MSLPDHPAYRLLHWFWAGIDLLYPPRCGGCGRQGARWCTDCQRNIQVVLPPVCGCCGQSQRKTGLCPGCRSTPRHYTALRSYAFFCGPLRRAIHQLKYRRDLGLGETLAHFLILALKDLCWQVDLVLPVPLGVARLKERGYNQVNLLAHPLALGTGLPFYPQALTRVRETLSQVGLTVAERQENVAGAFRARAEVVNDLSVLVVDDVTTSGATLEACAAALVRAGARQVFALTVARTAHGMADTLAADLLHPALPE